MKTRTAKRQDTPEEAEHKEAVASLGCYCCWKSTGRWVQPQLHHSRTRPDGQGYGTALRASHFEVMPLCVKHHANYGRMGEAIHAGRRTWVAIWGTELFVLHWVKTQLTLQGIGHPELIPLEAPF